MQFLASPHVKQVNWSVGCTVSSNMRAHITNKASAPKVIREAGNLGSNVNFWSALTFKKRFCYSGNGGPRKGGCMMATITCIFLYELNCAANGCFFFMGCLDQPHPKPPCLQMWSNLPDCCCRLQASSNSYFNIAERIMLLYVSLSSLGPFAMYCVGYLRCQCGEGGRNKACVCAWGRERFAESIRQSEETAGGDRGHVMSKQ